MFSATPLYLVFIASAIFSWLVSYRLNSKLMKYSRIGIGGGLNGCEVAEEMLRSNEIFDVRVCESKGNMADYYHPGSKTVFLSTGVYNGRSISAAAIAAHECGHAVQHATGYVLLKLRTILVPVQNNSARIVNGIFIGLFVMAFLLPEIFPYSLALEVTILFYGIFTAFAFLTLPVEINASWRALGWLSNSGITTVQSQRFAMDALKWAAYTYVLSALAGLTTLLYYLLMYSERRNY